MADQKRLPKTTYGGFDGDRSPLPGKLRLSAVIIRAADYSRRRYVRRKPVPRRQSMLDRYIVIEEWLAAEPHLSAVDILSRLEEQASGRFGSRQLARSNGWSRFGHQSQPVS